MPNIHKKYVPLYTSKKRYFILLGGRGSGKTFVIQDFLVRLLEEVGQGILYTRYTMTSAEKTIIPLFVDYIKKVSNVDNYEITRDTIIHKRTKAFIFFSGIKSSSKDQTGRLKTLPNISTWVVEEGEDFKDEKTFVDIDDSIRSDHLHNRVIWIQNPTTKNHFIWKRFFEGQYEDRKIKGAGTYIDENGLERDFLYQHSLHEEVLHIQSSYYDNIKNLNIGKVKQWELEKIKNPKFWLNNYGGAWKTKADGLVFENWEIGDFDESLPFLYGMDFGFQKDPTTLIRVAVSIKRKTIYVDEKVYRSDKGLEDVVQMCKTNNPTNLPIIADSAEPRLISDVKARGIKILNAIKGPDSVRAGISTMLGFKIVITKESTNTIEEFSNFTYSDKNNQIYIDDHNHAIDAIRYVVYFLLKPKQKGLKID